MDELVWIGRLTSRLLRASAVLCVLVLGVYLLTFFGARSAADPAVWGQFGDYIGGTLNPALAFLSLIAVSVALRLQIQQTTQALEMTRKQTAATHFFQLLSIHRDGLAAMEWTDSQEAVVRGVACARLCVQLIADQLSVCLSRRQVADAIEEAYAGLYDEQGLKAVLAHYYRNLFNIFKYVDSSDVLNADEKLRYIRIARSQLTTPEAVLLYYNGLHGRGADFRPLIERHALLRDVEIRDFRCQSFPDALMRSVYHPHAFDDAVPEPPAAG